MKARTQSEHERINRHNYPGTRQICVRCDEPTGRCEDDGIWSEELDGWVCPECSSVLNEEPYHYVCEYLNDVENFAYWCDINHHKKLNEIKDLVKEYQQSNLDFKIK